MEGRFLPLWHVLQRSLSSWKNWKLAKSNWPNPSMPPHPAIIQLSKPSPTFSTPAKVIGLTVPHISLVLLQDTCAVCFAHLYIYDVSPKVACMRLGKKTSVLSSFCSGYPGINSTDWVNYISDSPCALMSCGGFLQLWGPNLSIRY